MVEVSISGRDVLAGDISTHSLMHEHIYLSLTEIDRRYSQPPSLRLSPLQLRTKLAFRSVNRILTSLPTTILLTVCTLYALFGDDLRTVAFGKDADEAFDSVFIACIAIFGVEIGLTCTVRGEYRWSFYFFLDVLSSVSLLPDINWFRENVIHQGVESQVSPVQSAFRASRAGARTSKIIRVLRLFRILRLVKLYKATRAAMNVPQNSMVSDELEIPKESKIGKKLGELTTKRVIVVVIILLIILPLCDISLFQDMSISSWQYGVGLMDKTIGDAQLLSVLKFFIRFHKDNIRPLIALSIQRNEFELIWLSDVNQNDLRDSEKQIAATDGVVAMFDIRNDTKLEGLLSICRTLFICGTFALGAIYFTKDSNDMVIVPIEKMMNKVNRIIENPLLPMEDHMRDIYDVNTRTFRCCHFSHIKERETAVLEDSIMKIGALMALSFGEAGSAIISANLEKAGRLNLMLEGTKVKAVFAFCDIRNFTDTTEVLQEDIMVFINEIAAIVHYTIDAHLGAPNKNVGDAFLMVWKPPDNNSSEHLTILADLSIVSCLKILAYISSCPRLLKYQSHEGLLRRMQNYSVKIGFGVHFGWAIEGAMGSELKIDVSYLSSHVNVAAQLQEITKRYGVPLLFSSMLFNLLSSELQLKSRHIDTISFKSSAAPFRLFTYDIETNSVAEPKQRVFTMESSKKKRKRLLVQIANSEFSVKYMLEKSKKLSKLKTQIPDEFFSTFERAIWEYEKGNWEQTALLLETALEIVPSDQPSSTLYSFISETDFKAPMCWPGKPLKSPNSTQTGPMPTTPPLANHAFRSYFSPNPSIDDPFDRGVLSPHYTLESESRLTLTTATYGIPSQRTMEPPSTAETAAKRSIVFTSDGGAAGDVTVKRELTKPRTAMSQSRLKADAGNKEGITAWIQKYFRLPDRLKTKPGRKKTGIQSLDCTASRIRILPTLKTSFPCKRGALTRQKTELHLGSIQPPDPHPPIRAFRLHRRSATLLS